MAHKTAQAVHQTAQPQDEILIQKLTTIATIKSDPYGDNPMAVEAFRRAGEYLNQRAGQDGESDAVQFEYLGVTFHASVEVPQPPVPVNANNYD